MTDFALNDLALTHNTQRRPAKSLLVLTPECDLHSLLALGRRLSVFSPVLLLGVVPVRPDENVSAGAAAASDLRRTIRAATDRVSLRARARVSVSATPWDEVRLVLAEEPEINLLILEWPAHMEQLGLNAAELLAHTPCDIALIRGPFPDRLERILVPNLGDPHAERALRLSLALAKRDDAAITSLHIRHPDQKEAVDRTFAGMQQALEEMPDIDNQVAFEKHPGDVILEASRGFDLVVMGTKAAPAESESSLGAITDRIVQESPAAVIAVKTKRPIPAEAEVQLESKAISVLVDRWFAENTFHAEEFANLTQLVDLKAERGVTISLALPALNEEETIADIIRPAQRLLMEQYPLVDEIVLMDSNSTDSTREIAADLGVPVHIHQELLPDYGARDGKGEALWKSLLVTQGDLLVWVDTDIVNFHPRFIYGVIGPLLTHTGVVFVKGYYRRPLRSDGQLHPGRGGRVTELTARPLLNLFYPGLSGVIQPLSGEYAGRRTALESLPFSSGYGVEIGLLIDVFEQFKLSSIAQVDLLERIHRNQSLANLSKMSFTILQTLIRKLEGRYGQTLLEDVNRSMKFVHYSKGDYHLEVENLPELERPPMLEIPEYRKKRK